MCTVVQEVRMRVSERKSLIEEKKRWETRSSPSCNRASCRTFYNIDYVMVGTAHERYTTAVHVDRRRLSGILLNHPSPVEDVRIHGLGRPLAGTGDPGRLSRDGAAIEPSIHGTQCRRFGDLKRRSGWRRIWDGLGCRTGHRIGAFNMPTI
jgi:hypothetical protein